jgi:hypothetical protein
MYSAERSMFAALAKNVWHNRARKRAANLSVRINLENQAQKSGSLGRDLDNKHSLACPHAMPFLPNNPVPSKLHSN